MAWTTRRLRARVHGGIDPADEAVAVEDGEDVVAVAAGGFGDVDLHAEAEAEQALGPLAVDEEVVEGGEQGRPGLPVARPEALQ
jgi:predicted N-acetyltransferase YhbS